MSTLTNKAIDFFKNSSIVKDLSYNKFIFYFLFGLKCSFEQFKLNLHTKCLVLSQYPGAEIKGLGGLIAQNPKNFEILCLTNGSKMIKGVDPVESASIKKKQFQEVMQTLRVKGYKIFDIDDKTLKNHFSTVKKIDISEVDYIFVPNVYDNNIDTIALLKHFKQILKTKEHKETLKIIMYESDFSLCTFDYYVNIDSIIETKKNMLSIYYPEDEYPYLISKITGLNAFRSTANRGDFFFFFMKFSVNEFLHIPLI